MFQFFSLHKNNTDINCKCDGEIPGGRGVIKDPLEQKILGGANQRVFCGGAWIFQFLEPHISKIGYSYVTAQETLCFLSAAIVSKGIQ